MKEITGISLFSGAGGMDVGFENADIKILFSNEINKFAAESYMANRTNTNMVVGDINEKIDRLYEYRGSDIVFGGPPCQGFSVAGKMNPDDSRSKLIWTFLNAVEIIQPQLFIMENVKALAKLEKWRDIREEYLSKAARLGYNCSYVVLNAADFGVPQKRERVFFIGSKTNILFGEFINNLETFKTDSPTLREVLLMLPKIGSEYNENTCTAKITLASNPVLRKSPYAGMLFNGMGRPLNLDSVSNTLPASMGGNKTPIIDDLVLNNPSGFDWIKDYHNKLIKSDKVDKNIEIPPQLRRISITEAAAIQSFPRNYKFKGTRSAIYTQIGNAVPCKLAECVAKAAIQTYIE